MPEGPSIVILKEEANPFKGKKIINVEGNSKIDQQRLLNNKVIDIQSWGKHFLICFNDFFVRTHFLLFGSYRINEERDVPLRLGLTFKNGKLNFYSCSVRIVEGSPGEIYDWSTDVMSDKWDPKAAKKKLKTKPNLLACDAILDQNIFAGAGNIIKNEVLYRIRVHPASSVGKLPTRKLQQLIDETRIYSFQFYEWKKKFELKKHWLAHTKNHCHRCNLPILKEYMGVTNRRTFYCLNCQQLYI